MADVSGEEVLTERGEAAPRAGTIRVAWSELSEPYARLRVQDAAAESRLAAAIAQQGQRSAVLVVARAGDARTRYVLVDGYRRARVLRRLGRDAIDALLVALEEAEALAYCHRQETSRRRSAVEDGWLVRELVERHGVSLGEVGVSLGRTASWVSRRLGLVRGLPEEVEAAVQRGTVSPHAAMRSFLPLARANREACVKVVVGLEGERLTTREAALLYDSFRKGDAETRARIVEAPRMLLAAAAATKAGAGEKAPKRDDDAGRLAKELGSAASLVWRAKATLERALVVDRWVQRDDDVKQGFRRVTDAYAALARRFDRQAPGGH